MSIHHNHIIHYNLVDVCTPPPHTRCSDSLWYIKNLGVTQTTPFFLFVCLTALQATGHTPSVSLTGAESIPPSVEPEG